MPSWPQLCVLIAVIVLLFGTKKLRTLGEDLGAAIKGFKKALSEDDEKSVMNSEPTRVDKKASDTTKNK